MNFPGTIGVLDYGVGNLGSICNMLNRIGVERLIVTNPSELKKCQSFILPGVGSFDYCMQQFRSSDLESGLQNEVAGNKKPLLGICVGAQMLTRGSEEGKERGIGWVAGRVRKLKAKQDLKLPHMGWNNLVDIKESNLLGVDRTPLRFYFVHNYYLDLDSPDHCIARVEYGEKFCAAYKFQNIYGVQFHPEKSHSYGLQLLSNFANAS